MKLSTILATTCALSIYVSSELARAEGRDSYVGIQFASADTSIDGVPDDVDLDVATLQLGVWLSDNASLEFRVGKG